MKPIKAPNRPAIGKERISTHQAIAAYKTKHHDTCRRTFSSYLHLPAQIFRGLFGKT